MNQNQLLREQFNILGQDMKPNTVLTLTTNQSWNAQKMKNLVGKFFGRLDRKLLGAAWLDRPNPSGLMALRLLRSPM